METKHKVNIEKMLILGFINYFPLARNSPSDMDDLDWECREALNERLSPEGRGKALAEVEAILKRLGEDPGVGPPPKLRCAEDILRRLDET